MNIDDILDEIADGIVDIVKNGAATFADEAKQDLKAFLTDSEEDLKRYAQLLLEGKLTKADFKFLVGMKADGAEMLALSAKGIARTRIKHLLNSIRDLIIKTVFAAI